MLTTDTIYDRGIALYEAGAVMKTASKGIFNVGSYLVDTHEPSCTCAHMEFKPDLVCKHIVACLRLMLDDIIYHA